ncbi:MAG: hypothetical protein P9M14_10090 [Candidatus Alcyoniella australis]|nr:hypothetical protein [Candidatus Alcyoniella australis]
MANLAELIAKTGATIEQIREHLDALSASERTAQVVALGRKQQELLWELAETDPQKLTMDYLVPEGTDPLKPIPFEGKNSLPVFTRFRKVFYRLADGRVAGYNDQKMGRITGPGYYIAHPSPEGAPGPLVVDYTMIPNEHPAGWPEIKHNESGLSRFVYGGMHDFLRYVSDRVIIGRAYRAQDGSAMSNWFMLVKPE